MKIWLMFSAGLILGGLGGFFGTSFLLLDDVPAQHAKAAKARPAREIPAAAVAVSKMPAQKSSAVAVATSPAMVTMKSAAPAKPTAIAAESVDLDQLEPVAEGSMTTAKRDSPQADPEQ